MEDFVQCPSDELLEQCTKEQLVKLLIITLLILIPNKGNPEKCYKGSFARLCGTDGQGR